MSQKDLLFKKKEYLEKQLDVYSDNPLKLSEIFAELQSLEHKLKKVFFNNNDSQKLY